MLQVKLHFTEDALRLIAKKAMAKNTGARGLRAILENILTEAMFQVYYWFQHLVIGVVIALQVPRSCPHVLPMSVT